MNNNNSGLSSKVIWLVLIVGIIAASLTAVFFLNKNNQRSASRLNDQEVRQLEAKIMQPKSEALPVAELPPSLPKAMPIEDKGAKVVENFEAVVGDGSTQATREFESTNTISEDYALYEAFFKKSGWQILNSDKGETASITAMKDKTIVQVLMFVNTGTKNNSVRISSTITK